MNVSIDPKNSRAAPAGPRFAGDRDAAVLREAVLRRETAWLMQERDALRGDLAAARADAAGQRHAREAAAQAAADEAARLRQDLAYRDHVIASLHASRSWRMTASVRALSGLLRRLLPRSDAPVALLAAPGAVLPAPPHVTAAADSDEPASAPARQILVAADFLPLFDQQSGGLRLKTLIGILGSEGWSIAFASMTERSRLPAPLASPEGRARYEAALREAGVSVFLYGGPEIDEHLARMGRRLDWAFISFPSIAAQIMPLVRSRCPLARIAFDMVDFHGIRLEREAVLRQDPELLAEAGRQRALEVACALAADVTFAISAPEMQALLELAPAAVVDVIPNVFEPPGRPVPGPEGRDGLLFLGGFWHGPNSDAMAWFADEVWPLVRDAAPDAVLRIAGSNATDEVLALGERPGIEVLGFVPDLAPLFDRHRVFVAPLRYGAGMKGKVGQSLIHGLPAVASPIGAEGMDLEHGRHALIAEGAEAFATEVVRLLRDDALWRRLSAHGRSQIIQTLSIDVVRPRLRAALGG